MLYLVYFASSLNLGFWTWNGHINPFLLEPTHGHPTPKNFFWHRKLHRQVEYMVNSLKNIHEPYIL